MPRNFRRALAPESMKGLPLRREPLPASRYRARLGTSRRCSGSAEAEQRHGVAAADLYPVGLRDLGCIEPRAALHVILERIIDREQHAVGADGQHRRKERRRAEVAARRDVKITAEIVAHGTLGRAVGHFAQAMTEPP